MNYLVDTHLLLWAINASPRIPSTVLSLIEDEENDFWFSVVSVWEVALKAGLGRNPELVQPALLRASLLSSGFQELTMVSAHAVATTSLPKLRGDPFDRLLIAQAFVEGMIFLTSDAKVAEYPGPIRLV